MKEKLRELRKEVAKFRGISDTVAKVRVRVRVRGISDTVAEATGGGETSFR